MNQDTQKREFLETNAVHDEDGAMRNSLLAALQRNRTYVSADVSADERKKMRDKWAALLRAISHQYHSPVSDTIHVQNISCVSDVLSQEFAPILIGRRLRIGTSQKALNLYLKYLWCLDLNRVPPPHCPIDRLILTQAEIYDAWTQLDSPDLYMEWINKLREKTGCNIPGALQQWELESWNKEKGRQASYLPG